MHIEKEKTLMAVLILATVDRQTREQYDGMLAVLEPALRSAPGFIAHGAGPSPEGWRTFEVWETSADATRFFVTHIHPILPAGLKPRRSMVDLHSFVFTESDTLARAGRFLATKSVPS